ncbi:MAG: PEP-utilizing enzyme, partial [Deltaproteobacteria bacterium]|nr:PEP-utilizing enzyme [Deltaproteobacteria bacterium]
GRLYWNLGAVKARAKRLPGFVERDFDGDLGIHGRYEGDGVRTPSTVLGMLKALPLVLRTQREFRRQEKIARRCIRTYSDFEARYRIDLRSMSDSELLRRYQQLITSDFVNTEAHYFRTLFSVSVSKGEFRRILRKVDPEEKQLSYAGLISGLPPMDHFDPGIALWKSARAIMADPELTTQFLRGQGTASKEINREVDSFIQRFYYHSRRELDLTVPRWEEDPDYVLQMLRDYVARADSVPEPSLRMAKQRIRYEREREIANTICPRFSRGTFRRRLERLRRFIWLREQMRDCSTRMYYWVRKYCLEIARRATERGRIDFKEDIFYLRWDEAPLLLSSDAALRSRIRRRREDHALFKNFVPPTEIGLPLQLVERARPAVRASGASWKGIGVSSGVAFGPCKVIKTLDEADSLQGGDILVCSYTDPSWTSVLARVRAVIAETGGLLSHAAVICRELGIPAALNLPGATEFLTNGMQVRVDGCAGVVERVEGT